MKIIVTGATGVIGRNAIPELVENGHEVVGFHRRDDGATWLRSVAARPRRVDLFDPDDLQRELRGADVVIHLATSIPPLAKMTKARHRDDNDRLRTDATRNIVDAARQTGVARVVVESISFNDVDRGDHWITEDDDVRAEFRPTASALIAEDLVARFASTGAAGVSLRFAQPYGPGTASSELVTALTARKVPLVGPGTNFVSSIHSADAGSAVVASLEAASGRYNVGDDQPMRSRERLELQVSGLGAPTPRSIPAGLARILVGRATHQLTVSQRVLNRRFRDTTGWAPRHASVRDGWPTVVASPQSRTVTR
jgi:nucleoside-diphosphate-sugar epimerase